MNYQICILDIDNLFSRVDLLLTCATTAACLIVGLGALWQNPRGFASRCFFAGMLIFSIETVFEGLSLDAVGLDGLVFWQNYALLAKSFFPGVWLAFSLSYSRGNYREFLRAWRLTLLLVLVLLPLLALGFFNRLIVPASEPAETRDILLALSSAGKVLNVLVLLSTLLILANLERTFQNTVGTARWRTKFLILGLGLIFGVQVYTGTLTLLFSRQDLSLVDVETAALLIGCLLIAVAHVRRGFFEADVYPSHAFLQNSVTLLLAGSYLFIVGLLAQVVKHLGGSSSLRYQSLIILAGLAGLGILLLSERLRQRVRYFVSRHFRRPHYDFRQVWRELTERLGRAKDASAACSATAQMISETFNALSVTVWLLDDQNRWVHGGSTAGRDADISTSDTLLAESADLAEISGHLKPFALEAVTSPWARALGGATHQQFSTRSRVAMPLQAGKRLLGLTILGDRVRGMPYTVEEFELLKCLADQFAAALLNLRLGWDLALAREMETFQMMSAFFVHDLKNTASSLNLMLENLSRHFDEPEFREDALRGLGRTTGRINDLITRLSSFRDQPELNLGQTDLNGLVSEVIQQLGPGSPALVEQLDLEQPVKIDRDRIKSVVTNLIVNARDATAGGGSISVKTERRDAHALLTVADNGCGMSADFVQNSLFRPFQTTKKKGIGIGMFQARMIVEAHHGQIQVRSELNKGTTFQVTLPL